MEKIPPVKEGEQVDVSCESTGAKGDGICKVDGYVIIVPDAKPDNDYTVEIKKVTPRMAFAEICY
jgi:predicted RNA-binding protein with TRAM domain